MNKYLLFFLLVIIFISFSPLYAFAQEPTIGDVYDALLESKDAIIKSQQEKIDFLSNIIGWILALSAVISTIIIGTISYIYRGLLNDIKKRNKQLKQQEEVIAKVVEADEFQNKLDEMQEQLSKVDRSHKRLKKSIGDPWRF